MTTFTASTNSSNSQRVLHRFSIIFFVSLVISLLTIQDSSAQARRYVKQGNVGVGTGSWDNASGNLQAMINASAPGDEVWVMKGQYQPAINGNFNMVKGVKIYGSFAGVESTLSERVIGNTSADSSRLVGNGASVITNIGNGLDATAVLDGFFITGGQSTRGGGMYNENVTPTIVHCIFSGNTVTGMTTSYGGGICNISASPAIEDCIFSGNSIVATGGAAAGGGMFCDLGSAPAISNCIFAGNIVKGGAINSGGGLLINSSSTPVNLTNCSFLGNVANVGGGLFISLSPASLINCSFSGNSGRGGGVYNDNNQVTNANNCIFWGNAGGAFVNNRTPLATINNSIVEGGYAGTGNLNVNPLFVLQPAAAQTPTISGDLRLQPASPAINKGSNAVVGVNMNKDIAGNPRIYDNTVDMGAYEFQGAAVIPQLPVGNRTVTLDVIANSTTTFLADANGLVASLTSDNSPNAIAGSVTARVWVEPNIPVFNGQPYVARHYEITPPVSNATATVTLYFTQDDFTLFNATGIRLKLPLNAADNEYYRKNLRIAKYSLGSSDGTGLMDTYNNGVSIIDPDDANINWNGNYWTVSFAVNGFSGFFVQTAQNALPVKWINSNAYLIGNGHATISWKVQEQGVDNYEIQQSADGNHFNSTGIIYSKGDGENSYSFTTSVPVAGIVFYRIKQTDRDGRTSFSSTLKLQNNLLTKSTVVVYPNPVSDKTVIRISCSGAEKIMYELTDTNGSILQQNKVLLNAGINTLPFDMSKYAQGVYYLTIKGETINGQVKIIR